jgi:hypothetical protein
MREELNMEIIFMKGNCRVLNEYFTDGKIINKFNRLNPIRHLLALLGAHHILHVSRIRVKHRVKSHLPSAGIIRSSPYSPR